MDWQCPTCSLWYKTNGGKKIRDRHLRVHTGERPYECVEPRCGESFADTNDMMDHYRNIHSAAASLKQLECVLCGGHYTYQHDLDRHMFRARHSLAEPTSLAAATVSRAAVDSARPNRFVCHEPRCGMAFPESRYRNFHVRSVHTVPRKVGKSGLVLVLWHTLNATHFILSA